MLVLGLQGSPRKKGNSDFLLSLFMDQARQLGAQTIVIETDKKHIVPCKEYTTCERKGFCPIKDDMKYEIYGLLREADVLVAATPVFFFNVTAQLKSLIDRQMSDLVGKEIQARTHRSGAKYAERLSACGRSKPRKKSF